MNHRDPSCGVNGVTKSNYSVRRTTVIMVRLRLSDGSVFSTNYDNANERTSHLQRRRAKFLHVRASRIGQNRRQFQFNDCQLSTEARSYQT